MKILYSGGIVNLRNLLKQGKIKKIFEILYTIPDTYFPYHDDVINIQNYYHNVCSDYENKAISKLEYEYELRRINKQILKIFDAVSHVALFDARSVISDDYKSGTTRTASQDSKKKKDLRIEYKARRVRGKSFLTKFYPHIEVGAWVLLLGIEVSLLFICFVKIGYKQIPVTTVLLTILFLGTILKMYQEKNGQMYYAQVIEKAKNIVKSSTLKS